VSFQKLFIPEDSIQFSGFWSNSNQSDQAHFIGKGLYHSLLLNGFIFSYQSGGYDLRWIAFGLLSAAFLHYPIWLEKVRFEKWGIDLVFEFASLYPSKNWPAASQFLGFCFYPNLSWLLLNFPGFHSLQLILLLLGVNLGLYGLVIFQYQDIDWTKVIISSFFLAFILIFSVSRFGSCLF